MSDKILNQFRNRFSANETRFGVVRKVLDELPTIDIGAFVTGGDEASKRDVARQLRDASINIGFFFLKNHGLSQAELDDALEWTRKLFALPTAEKERLHQKFNPSSHGWFPTDHENLQGSVDSKPDVKEGFSLGRELEVNDPMEGKPLMGPNTYPSEEVLPGFEKFMRGHLAKLQEVSERLIRAFALSLGLEETYFDQMHEYPFGFARLNYYPVVTDNDIANQRWSCGAHTDYEGFTLLLQDDVGGLEVCNAAGDWLDIPPVPGVFVVNIGDLMSIWTNDLYASTPHRVRNVSGKKRYSFPYFYGPGVSAEIKCLDTCQGPQNPPKYPPTDVISYNVARVSQTHPLDTLAALRGFETVATSG